MNSSLNTQWVQIKWCYDLHKYMRFQMMTVSKLCVEYIYTRRETNSCASLLTSLFTHTNTHSLACVVHIAPGFVYGIFRSKYSHQQIHLVYAERKEFNNNSYNAIVNQSESKRTKRSEIYSALSLRIEWDNQFWVEWCHSTIWIRFLFDDINNVV